MTEEAWLGLTRLDPMLSFAPQAKRPRRATLFACACCRLAHDWSLPDLEANLIEATERLADGEIARRTWLRRGRALEADTPAWARTANEWERDFRDAVTALLYSDPFWNVTHQIRHAVRAAGSEEYADAFEAKLCSALRDVFGNPFRAPPALSPDWRTDTVVALARQMYEAREFGAMPILADALQDAGCTGEDVLNHCRDANVTHVRGCWVVDLVLGKT